jgi:hypothetical protein
MLKSSFKSLLVGMTIDKGVFESRAPRSKLVQERRGLVVVAVAAQMIRVQRVDQDQQHNYRNA